MLSDKILHALATFYGLPKAELTLVRNAYSHHPMVDLNLDNLLNLLECPKKVSFKELRLALDSIMFDLQYIEKKNGNISNELDSFRNIMRSQIYEIKQEKEDS